MAETVVIYNKGNRNVTFYTGEVDEKGKRKTGILHPDQKTRVNADEAKRLCGLMPKEIVNFIEESKKIDKPEVPADYQSMKKADLVAEAKERGFELDGKETKAILVYTLEDDDKEEASTDSE